MNLFTTGAEDGPVIDNPYPAYFKAAVVAWLGAALVFMAAHTIHWPLEWDGQVLHYINFLMAHGMKPYSEIRDMNLPGAYLIDGLQMHVFGPGDLAWRMYDFFLLGSILTGMMVIAWPYDWFAGFVPGALFALFHVAEGPDNAAQRDEIMTALLMLGYAALFQAVRRRSWFLFLLFGLCFGWANTIKPTTLPLAVVLMAMALHPLKKEGQRIGIYVLNCVIGMAVPAAIVVVFLAHEHAVGPFIELSKMVTPFYAGLTKKPLLELVRGCLPITLFMLLPGALAVAWKNRGWRSWERWALVVGIVFGLASYYAQHKGYKYHRYPFEAFLLLWMSLEFVQAIRRGGWLRRMGFAGLLFMIVGIVPMEVLNIAVWDGGRKYNEFADTLSGDLERMGVERLQGRVQCLDQVDGCMTALYHLALVQNTGFTGDLLLFMREDSPPVEHERRIFWQGLERNPPKVIVMSDEWFTWTRGFDKVEHWPAFAAYLRDHYEVVKERKFQNSSYRIYLRKD